jgi:hypothetical protein
MAAETCDRLQPSRSPPRSFDPSAGAIYSMSLRCANHPDGHRSHHILWSALLLPVLATCSSPVAPPRSVPLLITNTTCTPGPCQAIRILAFPQNQPRTPGGWWSLDMGVITTATACVRIPPSAHFTIREAGTDRSVDIPWTSGDSLALGPWAPTGARFQATPSTEWFVPQSAPGWRVALPGSAPPRPAPACIA